MELTEGHKHEGWDRAMTTIAELWPTPRPGWWLVRVNGKNVREHAIPADQIEAVLAEIGIVPESWTHWAVAPRERF
jgi:hypothetical protein